MLCKNCGTELNENAKFCNSCGAAAEKESVPDIHSVSPENDSGNQQGQYSFSGEPAAADEAAQPGEAVPSGEVAPVEKVPAAKKHNVLLYILIALAVIIVAVLIFRNAGKSETPTGSSGEYSPTSYDSGTSLSAEENWVVGVWYPYAGYSDGDTTFLSRSSGTLYLFNDHTGALYIGEELPLSFTWYYEKYRNGYYTYYIYEGNSLSGIGLYDFDYFALGTGENSTVVFER